MSKSQSKNIDVRFELRTVEKRIFHTQENAFWLAGLAGFAGLGWAGWLAGWAGWLGWLGGRWDCWAVTTLGFDIHDWRDVFYVCMFVSVVVFFLCLFVFVDVFVCDHVVPCHVV